MFITRMKGQSNNSTTPTLLYAYGGFGMSVTPAFWLSQLCWLEQGGIFAVANIRGGGEYGEVWHRAAVCERKQTSVDDLVSGATFLIEQGYTCPARLALMGMSNGGLLAAACLVQYPELFGAVVCQGPLTDMLRYHHFTVGRHLVAEYGNAEADPEQFRALLALSPLHNVRSGVAYPCTGYLGHLFGKTTVKAREHTFSGCKRRTAQVQCEGENRCSPCHLNPNPSS
jgi:prolyl oligopeptidase